MLRREFLGALAGGLAQNTSGAKPNIVLIVADDLGYGELGCQGNPQIPTPNIDSIATAGVRFTSGYVTAPLCCPSRAGLMTGRYQTRFGHEFNAIGVKNKLPGIGLPLTEKTIADHLKTAGYRTACIGKWHLGGSEKYHPLNRGFDEFFGFLHEGHYYVPPPYQGVTSHLRPNEPPYDEQNPLLRGREVANEKEYLTDALGREAAGFIERNRGRPYFLYLPFNAIHSPMQASEYYMKRFASIADPHRRVFAAMLSAMDDAIGAVLRKLGPNTLVIFHSDNGGPVQELTSSNAPLRGQKGQMYEGGIRIPFMMQWKSRIKGGRTMDQPVISCDLLPTILAAAGVSAPAGLDGVNLLPLLRGETQAPPHQTLFWRMGGGRALRKGNWKIVRQPQRGGKEPAIELFDLAADMSETKDLAASNPEKLAELTAAWARIDREMVPALW
ncbi:MAG TPA: sulfatase [Bryobacteraceae bacterium]|jgi:arylsulfatase B|nr:sulfatase [Bryobacteraceae bacterium]